MSPNYNFFFYSSLGHDIIARKLVEYLDALDKKDPLVDTPTPEAQTPPPASIPASV